MSASLACGACHMRGCFQCWFDSIFVRLSRLGIHLLFGINGEVIEAVWQQQLQGHSLAMVVVVVNWRLGR